mgnify:CR=1 FL=1
MTNDALYKIAYQLLLNKIHNLAMYEVALADFGAKNNLTEYYNLQLADAEEAEKLFDELRIKLLLEGSEADE